MKLKAKPKGTPSKGKTYKFREKAKPPRGNPKQWAGKPKKKG